MKHKIYASRFYVLLIAFLLLFVFYTGGCIYSFVTAIIANDTTGAFLWLVMHLVFTAFLVPFIIGVNRLSCKIYHNEETNEISREGLIRGFKYSVNIENIKSVIIVSHGRGGLWIMLIDNVQSNYDTFYKKSFIGMELNNKSIEFVKRFWDKPITQQMINGEIKEISDYERRLHGLK